MPPQTAYMPLPAPFLPAVDALAATTTALPLAGLGVIRASGPDARSFLQSQLSNDASQVSPQQGQLSGYCSPKGRLLAVLTLLQLGDEDFALSLPAELLPATLKRLKMFVLRSKLTLTDASAELPCIGLIGAEAASALQRLGTNSPEGAYAASRFEGGWALRRPGPLPRFQLWCGPELQASVSGALALPLGRAEDWLLAEVLSGLPQVLSETVDSFVPQTIDLDLAGGVSFTKGCYPGQEIVARVHYLGRVKQRLRLARATEKLAPGTVLFDAEQRSVGTVMACVPLPDGGAAAGVSLNVSHQSAPLHTAEGRVVAHPSAHQTVE